MKINKANSKYYYDKTTGMLRKKTSKKKEKTKNLYCASSVILSVNR